jgi:hypothetical protein
MSQQRNLTFTNWTNGKPVADITVWPLSEGASRHAELHGRLTVSIYTGVCNVSLKPTADEARALIAALQWALQAEEVAA